MSSRTKSAIKILSTVLLLTQSIAAAAYLVVSALPAPEPLCLLQDERLCVDNGCEATGGVCLLVEDPDGNRCICVY